MKKIIFNKILLNPVRPPYIRPRYIVPGPEGVRAEFENKKKARAYCFGLSEKINLKVIELNRLYCEVWQIYREAFFYWPGLLDREIKNFEFAFNRLFVVTSNYEYFLFINLDKCRRALAACLCLLIAEAKGRNFYLVVNTLKSFENRLAAIFEGLPVCL